eukprot:23895-Ditylum_brightwellii.AAC.1
MLEIAYAWAQHQTGWNAPILDDIKTTLPHFEVSKDPSYSLQQYGDAHLMPKLIEPQQFNNKEAY